MPISKIERAGMPGGAVLQVVQTQLTSIQSIGGTSGTWVDISGASAVITPSSSTNKILVMYSCMAQTTTPTAYYGTYLRVVRNGTVVGVGTAGTGVPAGAWGFAATGMYATPQSQVFLDSPATASGITYQLQVRGENSPTYVGSSTSGGNAPNIPTSLILMEIAA